MLLKSIGLDALLKKRLKIMAKIAFSKGLGLIETLSEWPYLVLIRSERFGDCFNLIYYH